MPRHSFPRIHPNLTWSTPVHPPRMPRKSPGLWTICSRESQPNQPSMTVTVFCWGFWIQRYRNLPTENPTAIGELHVLPGCDLRLHRIRLESHRFGLGCRSRARVGALKKWWFQVATGSFSLEKFGPRQNWWNPEEKLTYRSPPLSEVFPPNQEKERLPTCFLGAERWWLTLTWTLLLVGKMDIRKWITRGQKYFQP